MIEIDHVTKTFASAKAYAGAKALDDCTLTIEKGAFFVLIGPSGCGKSTLLRTINGLITPDAGTITLRGRDIARERPEVLRQGIGYVIQSVGLFPHWTIADNLVAVPRLLRWDEARIAKRRSEIVALLGIDPALLPRYPHQLSGGQRQRVGVARALAADPDLILMDEPFSALDPVSRVELQDEMRRIHALGKTTIVMVTHDVGEALGLATTLAVMRAGVIVQTGTPASIVSAPADAFVARFLGGHERALHLLDVLRVAQVMTRDIMSEDAMTTDAMTGDIAASATLREALSLMMSTHRTVLSVRDEAARRVGVLTLAALVMAGRNG